MARAHVRGYQTGNFSAAGSISLAETLRSGMARQRPAGITTRSKSLIARRAKCISRRFTRLDEGTVKIMISFNAPNGVQATANPFALTEILRQEMGVPRPGGNRLWRDERIDSAWNRK